MRNAQFPENRQLTVAATQACNTAQLSPLRSHTLRHLNVATVQQAEGA